MDGCRMGNTHNSDDLGHVPNKQHSSRVWSDGSVVYDGAECVQKYLITNFDATTNTFCSKVVFTLEIKKMFSTKKYLC